MGQNEQFKHLLKEQTNTVYLTRSRVKIAVIPNYLPCIINHVLFKSFVVAEELKTILLN